MFEEEAKEYAEENKKIYGSDEYADITDYNNVEKTFQEAAEFGYNKANEWHYTKDGDYPEEHQLVLLYRENSNGANVALSYWYKSYANDKVIAWKEVTPPKE